MLEIKIGSYSKGGVLIYYKKKLVMTKVVKTLTTV